MIDLSIKLCSMFYVLRHGFIINPSFVPQQQQEQFYECVGKEISGAVFKPAYVEVGVDTLSEKHVCTGATATRHSLCLCLFFSSLALSGRWRRSQNRLLGRVPIGLYLVDRVATITVQCFHTYIGIQCDPLITIRKPENATVIPSYRCI